MPSKLPGIGPIEDSIRKALSSIAVPEELQTALVKATSEMVDHFLSDRHRPAELHAGDFVEACARILQWQDKGTYTAVGVPLPPMDKLVKSLEMAKLDETFRIHIPRFLLALYSVRSRRGVGHLPGPISANRADAILLLTCSRWVLAEYVRVLCAVSNHAEAQKAVDLLSVTQVPIIEEFEGVSKVITEENLGLPDVVMILVHSASNGLMTVDELLASTSASKSHLQTTLRRLESRKKVHLGSTGDVALTSIGDRYAGELITSLS